MNVHALNKQTGEYSNIFIEDSSNIPSFILNNFKLIKVLDDCAGIDLEVLRELKLNEVEYGFLNEFKDGAFVSSVVTVEVDDGISFTNPVEGITIECRGGDKNDIQNVKNLIAWAQRNPEESISYKGKYVKAIVTLEKLQALLVEMEDYQVGLLQKKHSLEESIISASTEQELAEVKW